MIRNHLYVLAVPDLERSAAFYRDVLGFVVHRMGDPGGACSSATAAASWPGPARMPCRPRRWADGHRIMIGHDLERD